MSNTLDIVNAIAGKQKADALDMIKDVMKSTAGEALGMYKKSVASTYFDEPVEPLETEE
jgi:hypothetical protein